MSFNHRVIKTEYIKDDEVIAHNYAIHEVFYADDGTIESWTENPVAPTGETLGELRSDIERFKSALDKPVITERIDVELETGGETSSD